MSSLRRAVFTGVGLVTPIGLDAASFWHSLREGQSGIHTIDAFDPAALPVRFAGQIRGFDARQYIDRKERKRLNAMSRTSEFGVAAAQLALNDAVLDPSQLAPARFGVLFGAGTIPSDLGELGPAAQASISDRPERMDLQKWGALGIPLVPPMWMLRHVPNMTACHVSILHNAQGPNNTISQTDAGGLLALGEAFRNVQRGQVDVFLTGGADAKINPAHVARHCLFAQLSIRNDAPEKACRPFDRDRDGAVLGEGAGTLVLEEWDHARRRGARIYAEVLGFGAAFDRARTGAGIARAVRAALDEAGVSAAELDHINAQGYSTQLDDSLEARALREVFGTQPLPVFAPKSYFGNSGAASGPIELAASLLAMAHGLLPATLNYERPDPQCPVNVVRESRPVERRCFLKVGFTERGQCAALVCRHGD
jgi:3-oxoacyl-[acyl-carrier-protein] synthase II